MMKGIKCIIVVFFIAVSSFMIFTTSWLFDTWTNLSMDELVFHLNSPLDGTSTHMINEYIFKYGVPMIIIIIVISILYSSPKAKVNNKIIYAYILLGISVSIFKLNYNLKIIDYISNNVIDSKFIEDNYVDPNNCNIVFPDKKRNLIYIYLESMEVTYSDTKHGGSFTDNYIPELCILAEENDCFSNKQGVINGGISLPGTNWTMGAIFAETTGLPLKSNIGGNNSNFQDSFYSGVVSIGDILKQEGYNNIFLLGSDATFGGRRSYFEQHGDYNIIDYNYAIDNEMIPSDYYKFWGYEDEKLFSFAKNELIELSNSDEPFNLTMLTVDTHFEDGYICDLCEDLYKNNQYANVIACSSRQVNEFVEWIKTQDFYDNTTIVISGDHPTMDSDFCDNVKKKYKRKVYTAIINSVISSDNIWRDYSTFDMFPTTLASLGVSISGNKLGLGVNLYSNEQTIIEDYGLNGCRRELDRNSSFMNKLNNNIVSNGLIKEIQGKSSTNCMISEEDNMINIEFCSNSDVKFHNTDNFDRLEAELSLGEDKYVGIFNNYLSGDDKYATSIKYATLCYPLSVKIYFVDKEGEKKLCGYYNLLFDTSKDLSFSKFISYFNSPDYTVFMSICDEGTYALTETDMKELYKLGVQSNLLGQFRCSFYSIVSNGELISEKLDYNYLEEKGFIADENIEYEIISAGIDYGNRSSIVINEKEYSINSRGINIVVWDNVKDEVIGSVTYDTYESDEKSILSKNRQ